MVRIKTATKITTSQDKEEWLRFNSRIANDNTQSVFNLFPDKEKAFSTYKELVNSYLPKYNLPETARIQALLQLRLIGLSESTRAERYTTLMGKKKASTEEKTPHLTTEHRKSAESFLSLVSDSDGEDTSVQVNKKVVPGGNGGTSKMQVDGTVRPTTCKLEVY